MNQSAGPTTIADLMPCPAGSVLLSAKAEETLARMKKEGVDTLTVVDENGNAVGVIRRDQLTDALGIATQESGSDLDRRLPSLLAESSAGAWEYDYLTDRFSWSSGVGAMLGLPDESVPRYGPEWLSLVHPDDLQAVLGAIRHALHSDGSYEIEARYRRSDDSWCWLRSRARVVERRGDGWALRSSGMVMDISEQKETQLRLEAQNEFIRALADRQDLPSLIAALLDHGLRLPDIGGGGVCWLQPDGSFELVGERGLSGEFSEQLRRASGDKDWLTLIRRGTCLCSCTAEHPGCSVTALQKLLVPSGEGQKSLAIVPVRVAGEAVGSLCLTSPQLRIAATTMETLETLVYQFQQACERVDAQSLLLEERSRLRLLLTTIPDLVFLKNTDGAYLDCNPRCESLFGRPTAAILGKTDETLLSPGQAAICRSQDQAVMVEDRTQVFEETLTFASDGHSELLETIKAPVHGADGKVIGILGISRNIGATREAQAIFASVFNASPVSMAISRVEDGVILEVNPAGLHSTGWSREEIIGRSTTELGLWADAAARDAFFALLRKEGQVVGHPMLMRHRDGHTMPCSLSASFVEFRGELCVFSNIVDLSRQHAAETAIHDLQERFAVAFRASPVGILISRRADGRFVEMNDRFCRTFGWNREKMLGRTATELGIWSGPQARADFTAALDPEGHCEDFRTVIRDSDGRSRWISISAEAIQLSGEDCILSYVTDITDRYLAEQALRESQERFHSLFANMWEGVALHELERDTAGEIVNYRILDCNRRYEEILGISRERAIGNLATEVYGTESAPYLADFAAVALSGETRRITEFFAPLGRHFEISAIPWQNGFASIFSDVTDIRTAQEKLEEREELYSTLVNQAFDAITLIDATNGRFVECNEAAFTNLGYSREEFLKLAIADVEASLAAEQVMEKIRQILAQGGAIFETLLRRADGTIRETRVAVRAVKLRGHDYLAAIWTDITEQKAAAARLEETALFLRESQAIAHLGGWKANPETDTFSWTEEGYRLVKHPLHKPPGFEEVLGYFAPEYLEQIRPAVAAAWHDGTPFALELEAVARDGHRFWVDLRCIGRVDNADSPYLCGTFQDISERKAAEAALTESERRLNDIFAFLPDPTFAIDKEGRIIAWNRAMERLSGWPAEQVIGQGDLIYAEVFYGHRRPILIDRVLAGDFADDPRYRRYSIQRGVVSGETPLMERNGQRIAYAAVAAALCDRDGKVIGAIEQVRDITDLRLAEEKLLLSEERYRSVVNALGEGVIVYGPDGAFQACNPAAERILGLTEEQLLGLGTLHDFPWEVVREDLSIMPPSEFPIARTLATGEPQRDVILGIKGADWKLQWLAVNAEVVRDPNGHVVMALNSFTDITERRLAEQKLRLSEAALQEAQAVARLGSWTLDIPNNILRWSDETYRIFGVPRGTPVNLERFLDHIHPDDRQTVLKAWDEALDGRPYDLEHRIQVAGGVRWVREQATLRFHVGGEAYFAIGTVQDVTERRRTEEELQKLSLATEQAPHSVIITGLDQRIQYVNESFVRITGYSRDEAVGRTPGELVGSGLTPQSTHAALRTSLATGQPWQGEFINRRKDGSIGYETAHILPVRQPDGRISHYLSVQEDITERKRIAAELDSHQQHLETLVAARTAELEAANRRLTLSDSRLKALFALSQEASRLSEQVILERGLREAQRLTGSAAAFLHLADESPAWRQFHLWGNGPAHWHQAGQEFACPLGRQAPWEQSLRTGLVEVRNAPAPAADPGEPQADRLLRYVAIPVRDEGEIRAVLGVANKESAYDDADVHELQLVATDLWRIVLRRRAETALAEAKSAAEQASEAKSAFVANMSHEIRTPMNAIIGMTHLALRFTSEPAQQQRLQRVADAAQHLLGIINDILDISKIESGKLVLEDTDFSLAQIFDNVASLIGERAHAKGLAISQDIDPTIPAVLRGDGMRVGQVLINFLGNAVKFTDRGHIDMVARLVGMDDRGVLVRLEVRDTGIGIAPEVRQRLFSPFEQADTSTTRKYGGTGLGLAISRRLAGLMGGEIGVSSTPGHGSIFWFTARLRKSDGASLDRPLASQQPAASQAEQAVAATHAGAHILLVEDNPINQEVALSLLRGAGLRVDLAENGAEAVEMATRSGYALILMDVQMPVMDGLAATRAIRASLGPDLPILAMTANAFGEDRERCLEAGMNDHIGKPVNVESLFSTLLRWLPQGRAAADERAPAAPGAPPAPPLSPSPAPTDNGDMATLNALAGIPGLDVEFGLKSVRNRLPSYLRLLGKFVDNHRDEPARIRAALAGGGTVDGQRFAHSLKGVAAMLGAKDIQAAAVQVEAAIRDNAAPSAVDASIDDLQAVLDPTLAAIAAILPETLSGGQ